MQTKLKTLTGAKAFICSAHKNKAGQIHGHTWEVIAWWTGSPCAVMKQKELKKYLESFDHTLLTGPVGNGEFFAKMVLEYLLCEKVEVIRSIEGLYASVEVVK